MLVEKQRPKKIVPHVPHVPLVPLKTVKRLRLFLETIRGISKNSIFCQKGRRLKKANTVPKRRIRYEIIIKL
jgi:hypothetical protein